MCDGNIDAMSLKRARECHQRAKQTIAYSHLVYRFPVLGGWHQRRQRTACQSLSANACI